MSLFRNLLIEKKRRKYYVELEYLESTGTQYIDTGYKMSAGKTMTFNGNIMWTQSNGIANFFYGYRSVNSATATGDMRSFFVYGQSGGGSTGRLAIRYGVNTDNSTSILSLNQRYNLSFDGTNLKVNGTTFVSVTAYYTPANYQNMYLFWCNCTGYYSADVAKFSGRIYNWQIFEDGVLVRDMIPVLGWDGKGYMYDKVSGQLFGNAGTGDFVLGRQIHPVEYLESTGEQRIDTGYIPNQNTTIEFNIQLTSTSTNWAMITGRRSVIGTDTFFYMQFTNSQYFSNSALWFVFGPQANTTALAYPNPLNEHIITISVPEQKIIVDGNTTSFTGSIQSGNNYPLNVFSSLNASGSVSTGQPLKLYYYKIWDNDTPVRDFIPAISEDGTAFMFDRVTHTCFLNKGTGAFKYPAREVEYLESTGTQYIDTGIFGKSGLSVKTKVNYTYLSGTSSHAIGGEYIDGLSCYFGMVRASGNFTYLYRGTVVETNTKIITDTDYTLEVTLNNGSQVYTLNGNVISSLSVSGDFNSNKNLYLYAINSVNGADVYGSLKMYYLQIHDGGVLVRDFIPCFQNGVAGMLDKANNVFYPNAGTGTFTAGRIIEPEYE